jgi:TonB family protein
MKITLHFVTSLSILFVLNSANASLNSSYSLIAEQQLLEDQQFEIVDFGDIGDSIELAPTEATFPANFPGGDEALTNYIKEKFIYPLISKEMGDQGEIIVQFVVEKDGSISHVRVKSNLTKELDQEALRVVRSMPKWQAGMLDGRAIRMTCTLPIDAELQ